MCTVCEPCPCFPIDTQVSDHLHAFTPSAPRRVRMYCSSFAPVANAHRWPNPSRPSSLVGAGTPKLHPPFPNWSCGIVYLLSGQLSPGCCAAREMGGKNMGLLEYLIPVSDLRELLFACFLFLPMSTVLRPPFLHLLIFSYSTANLKSYRFLKPLPNRGELFPFILLPLSLLSPHAHSYFSAMSDAWEKFKFESKCKQIQGMAKALLPRTCTFFPPSTPTLKSDE